LPETHRPNEHEVIIIEDESLRQGFTQIPNAILRRPDVTSGAKITYMALLSYAWQKDSCFPGQETLALDTGVGKRSVIRYLQELQGVGLLEIKRRGLGLTNVYVLKKIFGIPRSANLAHQEMPKTTHPEVPIWHPKEYEDKEEEDENYSNIRMRTRTDFSVDNSQSQPVTPVRNRSVSATNTRSASKSEEDVESIGTVLKRGRGRPPKEAYDENRERIFAYINDFARELGDNAPLKSSVTRAYNLYRASGASIERFTDAMYQAKAKTKEHSASIRTKRATGDAWAPKAKMGYWFSVLEQELGLEREKPTGLQT